MGSGSKRTGSRSRPSMRLRMGANMPEPSAPMVCDGAPIEEVRAFFADDRFATQACKAEIIEARKGHAVCECPLEPIHRNAMGGVMGGAIFTLADFALAVASNVGESPTVSVSNSIEFISTVERKQAHRNLRGRQIGALFGILHRYRGRRPRQMHRKDDGHLLPLTTLFSTTASQAYRQTKKRGSRLPIGVRAFFKFRYPVIIRHSVLIIL